MGYKRIPYADKEQWLELRTKGIGGSDCASILGLNPWMTNVQLWKYKTGIEKRESVSNELTEYGHDAEEFIRDLFAVDYKSHLEVKHTEELLVNDEKSYFRASLDGELECVNDFVFVSFGTDDPIKIAKGMKGILEIKTTTINSNTAYEKWKSGIPYNYYCQILHYFLVKDDTDFFILRVKMKSTNMNGVVTYTIRDYGCLRANIEKDIEMLRNAEVDFWENYVIPMKEPALKIC